MLRPFLLSLFVALSPLAVAHDENASPTSGRSHHEQPWEKIDRIVGEIQAKHNVSSGPLATTDEFVRRTFLDLTGRPPTPEEAMRFSGKELPQIQHQVCDYVLDQEDYGMYWSTYWKHAFLFSSREDESVFAESGDTFNHRKLKIDLVSDFNQKAHRLDQTLWKLITSTDASGLPGWYIGETKKEDEKSEERVADFHPLTDKVARTFLGVRIGCVQCHDDVLDGQFTREDYWSLNAYFRNYRVDGKDPGKVELSFTEKLRLLQFEKDNEKAKITPSILGKESSDKQLSPLEQLAENLPSHELFSKAIVNRYWHQLFGFSLNWPRQYDNDLVDDQSAAFNPLWEALSSEFRNQKHKPRELLRWICKSKTYARTSVGSDNEFSYFTRVPAKPLTEEQLSMTMASMSGKYNRYDFFSKNEDSIARFDSIVREDGLYRVGERRLESGVSPQHVLNMMNGLDVEGVYLKPTASRILKNVSNATKAGPDRTNKIIEETFRSFVNRAPGAAERAALATLVGDSPSDEDLQSEQKRALARGMLNLFLRNLGRSTTFEKGIQIEISFPNRFQDYQLAELDRSLRISPDDEPSTENLFIAKAVEKVDGIDWNKISWDEVANQSLALIGTQRVTPRFLVESGLNDKIEEFKSRATRDYWLTHELTWVLSNSNEFLTIP